MRELIHSSKPAGTPPSKYVEHPSAGQPLIGPSTTPKMSLFPINKTLSLALNRKPISIKQAHE